MTVGDGSFHEGEVLLQTLTGERAIGIRNERFISDRLPANAAGFLAEQRIANIALSDDKGRAWSFIIVAPAPFITVETAQRLAVQADGASTPKLLFEILQSSAMPRPAGMVFIDLARGRRFRVNGKLEGVSGGRLDIAVEQTCPNCPKYIQRRVPGKPPNSYAQTDRERGTALSPLSRELIECADTFFTASRGAAGAHDASHRGGNPGFVRVVGNRLTIPDYIGNSMFMTLGNFQLEPAGGLTFVDFEGGRQLNLTGRAAVDFSDAAAHNGDAGRFWTFDVEEWNLEPFLPDPAWTLEAYSRFNPPVRI